MEITQLGYMREITYDGYRTINLHGEIYTAEMETFKTNIKIYLASNFTKASNSSAGAPSFCQLQAD